MRHLNWSKQNLTAPTFNKLLKENEEWQSAETIDLSDNFINNSGLILRLCQSPFLKEINLLNNPFVLDLEMMDKLAIYVNIIDFRTSSPHYSFLSDNSFMRLYVWLERNKRLQTIKLLKNNILDLSYLHLSEIDLLVIIRFLVNERITHLREINLSYCHLNITEEIMKQLAECIGNNKNCRLKLQRNKLEAEPIPAIKKLMDFIHIESDDVQNTSCSSTSSEKHNITRSDIGLRSLNLEGDWESDHYSLNTICYFNQIDILMLDFSYLDLSLPIYTDVSKVQNKVKTNGSKSHLIINSKLDLDGANFACSNLSYSFFDKNSMKNACLMYVNASHVIWFRVDLSGARLGGINFSDADLSQCILDKADLHCAHLSHCNMTRISMRNVDCSMLALFRCSFYKADLTQINFSQSEIIEVTFRNTKLDGANFSGAHFSKVDFSQSDLTNVDLSSCTGLLSCSFEGANLQGVRLPYYLLYGSEIRNQCHNITTLLEGKTLLREIFVTMKTHLIDPRFDCFSLHQLSQLEIQCLFQEGLKNPITTQFVSSLLPFSRILCHVQVEPPTSVLENIAKTLFFKKPKQVEIKEYILLIVKSIDSQHLKEIYTLCKQYNYLVYLSKSICLTAYHIQQLPYQTFSQQLNNVEVTAFILERYSMKNHQKFSKTCNQILGSTKLHFSDNLPKEEVNTFVVSNDLYLSYGDVALREIPVIFTEEEFNLIKNANVNSNNSS